MRTFLLSEIARTFARKITVERYATSARAIDPPGPLLTWVVVRVAGDVNSSLDAAQLFDSAKDAAQAEFEVRQFCELTGVAISERAAK